MVIFHDDPEKYNNPILLEEIEQQVRIIISICFINFTYVVYFIFLF